MLRHIRCRVGKQILLAHGTGTTDGGCEIFLQITGFEWVQFGRHLWYQGVNFDGAVGHVHPPWDVMHLRRGWACSPLHYDEVAPRRGPGWFANDHGQATPKRC